MISKNTTKFIIGLQKKKVRDEERLYVIEGDKIVREFLAAGIQVKTIIAKAEFLSSLSTDLLKYADSTEEVNYEELKQISSLKTPHNAMALVPIPEQKMDTEKMFNQLVVALDFVQDPGNLGTIIRSAAWFGIKYIVCSPDCVDVYNPKVIQASMGAILHVNVYYSDLKTFITEATDSNVPVFGTLLDGESIYSHKLATKGIILLGNESKGISEELIPLVTEKIMIPKFNKAKSGIESLNVSMAASVVFSEFLRKS